MARIACGLAALVLLTHAASAQSRQKGIEVREELGGPLQLEYVGYRPAEWETEHVTEPQNERVNEGGLLYLYVSNPTDEPVRLRHWWANGEDRSYWILGGGAAWDRAYADTLQPGQLSVLEINAVDAAFGPGSPLKFGYIGGGWRPVLGFEATLSEDPIQIACIRVLPDRQRLDVHVRNAGPAGPRLTGVTVPGREIAGVDIVGATLRKPGHAIARVELAEPLATAQLLIVRAEVTDDEATRAVYAHRRAFPDVFPIGTWRSTPPEELAALHIDHVVQGALPDNPWYEEAAPEHGLYAMVHTTKFHGVDILRAHGGKERVTAWMPHDEPDWSTPPNLMLKSNELHRHYDQTKPTLITLCRNVKFFEYAPIPDIPCQDHYCVAAPSSSRWPTSYGTRLEETAYYTRDLKRAAEPKPIWVWSQLMAGWDRRPQRNVPTPEEMAAQLMLNVGRGAKGILWFNYGQERAEQWPDLTEAFRGWNRVLLMARDDLLASEPADLGVEAPEGLDVAPLVTRDALFLAITNTNYDLDPAGYVFTPYEELTLTIEIPAWLRPVAAAADLGPGGVTEVAVSEVGAGRVALEAGGVNDCRLVVLAPDPGKLDGYRERYDAALAKERDGSP